jgi:hypothetical protein
MTYEDERQAASKAQAVIASLTPETMRTDAAVFAVRYAAGTARDAVTNLPYEGALNDARIETSSVLGGLQGLMEVGAVTPDMIERSRRAVAAWLRELTVLDH